MADKSDSFALEVLRKNCNQLFKVETFIFDGATAGLDNDKQYTIAQCEKTIKDWLNKPLTKEVSK
jgi:hypothetical protein